MLVPAMSQPQVGRELKPLGGVGTGGTLVNSWAFTQSCFTVRFDNKSVIGK